MSRILGIIPARKGSKRVPDKNFRPFAGKPLFAHVVEAALQSKVLTDVALSTNHDQIIELASVQYKKLVCIRRPDELSSDTSPAIDFVHHTLRYFQSEFDKTFDVVVILQPSSPFTIPTDIDNTVNLLLESKSDSAVSVVKLDHMIHPVKMKHMDDNNRLLPFFEEENNRMTAGELPVVYVRNCSVYVTRMESIRENQIIGPDCRGFVMPPERSIDINEMLDFEFAEFMAMKRIKERK
ncbi:MAG: acylneuraminate cytidylyltransferase family protein [Cytophagales bacterium]|nr:acylneuraminate cytidylyltransferase family protein [Cytophagales bacterium]